MRRVGGDRPAVVIEDSYEPAALDVAWVEYREADSARRNSPEHYAAFRAGYRRGIAQGALLAASTFVHGSDAAEPLDHSTGENRG